MCALLHNETSIGHPWSPDAQARTFKGSAAGLALEWGFVADKATLGAVSSCEIVFTLD